MTNKSQRRSRKKRRHIHGRAIGLLKMRYGKTRYLGAVIREMRRLNTKSPRKAMASLVLDIRNDLLGQLSKMNRSYKQETATRAEDRLPIN